ncbi:hypothetical protein A2U01_0071429, partial [Trifolium medium]|nr:hypothetical protein [Trifolium medium]
MLDMSVHFISRIPKYHEGDSPVNLFTS